MPRVIGRRLFTDGVSRRVVEDEDGRRWVVGHDGEPAYGNWIVTDARVERTPIVVQARE